MKAAIAAFLLVSINLAHSQISADKQKAADQGDARAQDYVANMYQYGAGVKKDSAKALEWFQKAADQGNVDSEVSLAQMYGKGNGIPKDIGKAKEWYKKAADQGDADILIKIADIYYKGDDIPQDYSIAFELYRKAAEMGDMAGQFQIGAMYYAGEGAPKDYNKSMEWFQKAANQGLTPAMENIALLYDNGRGVPKDPDKATKWYEKANELNKLGASDSVVPEDSKKEFAAPIQTITITAVSSMGRLHDGNVVPEATLSKIGEKYIFLSLRENSYIAVEDAGCHLYQIPISATDYKSSSSSTVHTETSSRVNPSTPNITPAIATPNVSTLINKQVTVTLNDGSKKTGKLIRADTDSITLLTDDGGGKVLFSAMIEADRTRFGYVPSTPSGG